MKIDQLIQAMKIGSTEKKDGSSSFQKVIKYCEFCGEELIQETRVINGRMIYIPLCYKDCSCEKFKEKKAKLEEYKRQQKEQAIKNEIEQKRKEKIKRLFGNSYMSKRALSCKFEGYQITFNNQEAVKACHEYIAKFKIIKSQKRNGLFLVGNCGVGKSHLACATANALIENGTSVICMTMIDLLMKLKSSYDTKETEEEILKVYEDCSLLIIDDLGKEKMTEWALQMVYAIIDRRYNAFKPIIVTSNYNAEQLISRFTINGDNSTGRAIVDRLFEMCQYLPIKGESFRKR